MTEERRVPRESSTEEGNHLKGSELLSALRKKEKSF